MKFYTLVTIIVSLKSFEIPPYISENLIFKSDELCEIALDDIYKEMEYINKVEFDSVKFVINKNNDKRILRIKNNNESVKFHSCSEGKIHFNKEKIINSNKSKLLF